MIQMPDHEGLDIRPISELRHYKQVLKDVVPGHPVFLTKNGYGKYVILNIKDYNELMAIKHEEQTMTTKDIHQVSDLRDYKHVLETVTPEHEVVLETDSIDQFGVLLTEEFYMLKRKAVIREVDRMVAHARLGETKSLAEVRQELLGK